MIFPGADYTASAEITMSHYLGLEFFNPPNFLVYPTYPVVLSEDSVGNNYTTFPSEFPSWKTNTFKQDFYYKIHLIPAVENVGSISSDITRTVRVWSSFFDNNNLETIIVSGDDTGILTGFTAEPYEPLEEKSYQVQVTMDGPATFNVTYSLEFQDGIGIYNILGDRIVVFTFKPNWKEGITEVYEYLTSVDSTYSGKEVRESVRNNPRRTLEYQTYAYEAQIERFDRLLWANQGTDISIPLWQHSDYFDILTEGTVEITLDTEDKGYTDSAVFIDEFGDDIVIEIASISSNQITLNQPLPRDFTGVTVAPVRPSFAGDNIPTDRLSSNLLRNRASIEVSNHEAWIGDFTATQVYNDKPVWLKFPNRESRSRFSYQTDYFDFDSDISGVRRQSKNNIVRSNRTYDFVFQGRENIYDFHKFFNWTKGKTNTFYMPLWERSMNLTEGVAQGSATIVVDFLDYEAAYSETNNRDVIAIYIKDQDTWLLRTITGFTDNGETTDLQLSDPFPENYGKDNMTVFFMENVRFGTDRIEMTWRKNNLIETSINFVSVVE